MGGRVGEMGVDRLGRSLAVVTINRTPPRKTINPLSQVLETPRTKQR